ncbi:hypothetical protein ZIOFF_057642 [Zingiber officinale]|uniref:Uncharacterized protein n=1 Tax=Zingiber officinale TaxID=94328 RepID=A0A8J5KAD3_ZINOF|nr:hypothetical protein ZIOFF_057642 [Zingiber officinale]
MRWWDPLLKCGSHHPNVRGWDSACTGRIELTPYLGIVAPVVQLGDGGELSIAAKVNRSTWDGPGGIHSPVATEFRPGGLSNLRPMPSRMTHGVMVESFRASTRHGGPLHLVSNLCPFSRKGNSNLLGPERFRLFEFRRRETGILVAGVSGVDETRNRSLGSDKFPFSYQNDLRIEYCKMEMNKPGLKDRSASVRLRVSGPKKSRSFNRSATFVNEDTTIFIEMAQDKKEGNKLFQRREYEDALLKYEKAIKLLPKNHIGVAYVRSNMAASCMQMNPEDYHQAINECNLAPEVVPNYSKALVKRAKCFEALDMLDLACEDADLVLRLEPNNIAALEISERMKKEIKEMTTMFDDRAIVVVDEKHVQAKEEFMKSMKLLFGEDIRYAQVPANCAMLQLREIICIALWEECLMTAMDKFTLAKASSTDIAVMVKSHCANETTQECKKSILKEIRLGFKIDEIVQAWNEMYDAKRWPSGVSSSRLEPLLHRQTSKLHQMLEHWSAYDI